MQVGRTASFDNETPIPDIGSTSEKRLLPGWVVGGGLEYALHANLSVKAEYLYARFSESTLGYSFDFEGSALPVRVREQLSLQVARVGLNYHFGNPGVTGAVSPTLHTKAPTAWLQGFTWSGVYAGAHAGWARTRADFDTDVFFGVFQSPINLARFSAAGTGRASADGFTGGGQLGANAQFGGMIVGLEGDISHVGSSATLSRTNPINPPPSIYTIASTTEVEWLATIRVRLGLAFDRSLLFVTAGGAIARLDNTPSFVDTTPAPSDSGSDSRKETLGGYVLGGGIEHALWDRWSIKAEYLHTRLSRGFVDYAISHPGNTGITNRVFVTNDLMLQTVRLGVNYRFGGPDVR
jgi:outer membrane immunogenic protein